MAKLISQSCGELHQAACLSKGEGAIWRPPEHSWTSDKPQKQDTPKQLSGSILAELLVNVYSFHLMMKVCLVVMCMKVGFLKSSNKYSSLALKCKQLPIIIKYDL